jgi:UDPglucose 6-dehydrogenase
VRRIAVIGTGYVGLVTGTCFAELGNEVVCIDTDLSKIASLRKGEVPFYEPGLSDLVARNASAGRLRFTEKPAEGIQASEVVFIAVGTPTGPDGHADLTYVRQAAHDIAVSLNGPKVVVNKSTVPVETGDLVGSIVAQHKTATHAVSVVSNPEFLREGSAINDFMMPDRIVIGTSDRSAEQFMRDLYAPLNAQIVVTDVRTAEMIKYTANAFLATKISFINEIAHICDEVGADVTRVVVGAGSDKRIGTAFMNAGLGFGGSCFPKDVLALIKIAHRYDVAPKILDSVLDVNRQQVHRVCRRVEQHLGGIEGRQIGLLGLAFKPNTDDVRESPAIALAQALLELGARITAHDPVAIHTAKKVLGDTVTYVERAYEVTHNADATIIATDWNEYKNLDLEIVRKLMKGTLFLDARNIHDPEKVREAGLHYAGVGRGAPLNGKNICV